MNTPGGWRMEIPKLLDQLNQDMRRQQAMELERQRIEGQRMQILQEQQELNLLQAQSFQWSPEWCATAMRVLGYQSIDQFQKMVLFEQMKARKCMN